jgi:hypothetical protein
MPKPHLLVLIGLCLGHVVADDALAQPGDPPPAPVKKHELRIVRVGETYQGFRLRSDTGESWQIEAGAWRKVVEADPVPVGGYDILLAVAGENLLPMRIDHTTGHTWFLQARQWVKYDEPDAADGAAKKPKGAAEAKGKNYDFRQARVGDVLHLLRFETRTGAAWVLRGTGAYVPLTETGPVPAGDYDVTTVATEKNWMAFRLDRLSGAAWLLRNNAWIKVKEPEPD